MTSAIVFSTIDETYPVAGQDNNSQGFRDNFDIIKSALNTASSEITDLQNNTAKTDVDNDFNSVQIANAILLNNRFSVQNLSSQPGNFTISTDDADMYFVQVTTAADCLITLANWPASSQYRKIRLIVNSGGVQKNVRFNGGIMRYSNVPLVSGSRAVTVLPDTNSSYHFEISTYDGGVTIYVLYLGQFTA